MAELWHNRVIVAKMWRGTAYGSRPPFSTQ